MTLANKVTSSRFFLSFFYFGLLAAIVAGSLSEHRSLLIDISFVLFVIIGLGDILDGYLARRYKEVTHFGRIADPFVDKIISCGSFTFFLSLSPLDTLFPAWFVVVILSREFLVQGIRSAAEASGIAFPANNWGKIKTFVQNTTVGTGLCYASHFQGVVWTEWLTFSLMWLTLILTVASGMTYVNRGRLLFRSKDL